MNFNNSLKTSDFDYDLPPEYIAQTPVEPRHDARMLVMDRQSGEIQHAIFRDLGQFLNPGDILVLNETRVIPARLYARKIPTGGQVEILLLRKVDNNAWEALVGGKGLLAGRQLVVEKGPKVEIEAVLNGPLRILRFSEPVEDYLIEAGHVPLPPYIHTPLQDPERYQTVYARDPGSVAAPTAGLHFTTDLIHQLMKQGIRFTNLTLHVGLDTFAPVEEEDPYKHTIHTEWYHVSKEAAEAINQARSEGGRIFAVGTTTVRALESAGAHARRGETVGPCEGWTNLFVLPGYTFRVIDAMITNFHLPRSTLLMLVSAFAGREKILKAYQVAIKENYRFYSFGDAMLILSC